MMEWLIAGIALGVLVGFIGAILAAKKVYEEQIKQLKLRELPLPQMLPPAQVNVNMRPLEELMKQLPNKVLQSIQSSVNTKKGALGELIGYIELEAQYDRIIPLGNIVDFMCIKFPEISKSGMDKDGVISEGRVDFVDIKTGKSARLSKDQKMLQELIKNKKVNFVKVTVNTQTSENNTKTE